jgi:heme/copper-type cytochrome/quinol oxidase subunit 2
MKVKRSIRLTLFAASVASALLAWSLPALAQCAMCKNAVTGSPEAARLSQSLNFAILILLIPPVLIFCGIFFVAYRYRKSRGAAEAQSSSEI